MATSRDRGGRSLTIVSPIAISPSVIAFEAGDHAQESRLAAARGTDENDELAVLEVEVDPVDHGVRPKTSAPPDRDARHPAPSRLSAMNGAFGLGRNSGDRPPTGPSGLDNPSLVKDTRPARVRRRRGRVARPVYRPRTSDGPHAHHSLRRNRDPRPCLRGGAISVTAGKAAREGFRGDRRRHRRERRCRRRPARRPGVARDPPWRRHDRSRESSPTSSATVSIAPRAGAFPGLRSSISAVLVDGNGERMVINYSDPAVPADPSWLPASLPEGAGAVLATPVGERSRRTSSASPGPPACPPCSTPTASRRRDVLAAATHVAFAEQALFGR